VSAPFAVDAGKVVTLRLRLPAATRRSLARRGFLVATATLVTLQPDGTRRSAGSPLVLLAPRR
jgi:hypothetical protein